jgi:hypothetical protein
MVEIEAHDPILRIDQLIHRQDQTVQALRDLARIAKLILYMQAGILLTVCLFFVWAAWK